MDSCSLLCRYGNLHFDESLLNCLKHSPWFSRARRDTMHLFHLQGKLIPGGSLYILSCIETLFFISDELKVTDCSCECTNYVIEVPSVIN